MTRHCALAIAMLLLAGCCQVTEKTVPLQGFSLMPAVPDGTPVTLQYGYYKCHSIQRGDIVAFRSGGEQPLAKYVRGLPGDSWTINGTGISINSEPVKNSEGKTLVMDAAAASRLAQLNAQYKTVPPGNYLVFSDDWYAGTDSRQFGFVDGRDIIGRVIPPQRKATGNLTNTAGNKPNTTKTT